MSNKFDELAKGLAQSVTRRQAFKRFGVGLAGMALASLLRAESAHWLAYGLVLNWVGDACAYYVGKSMAGGEIILTPPAPLLADGHRHVIAGNTLLYGATGGGLFAAGRVGERFAVRNSGAVAVVEGLGDHGCEYMTGGTVVVLGETGRNFGAGMSGGEAFVYDETGSFPLRYNTQLVTITRVTVEDGGRVRDLVAAHARATGSRRARMLLGNWEAHIMKFWKVAPRAAGATGGQGDSLTTAGRASADAAPRWPAGPAPSGGPRRR